MAKQKLEPLNLTNDQIAEFSEITEEDIIDAQRVIEKFMSNKYINLSLSQPLEPNDNTNNSPN